VRAVTFEGIGRVAVREVANPRLEEPSDALVRVSASAICGSDLHFLSGKAPIEPGETLGHEAVGVVEEVGDEVVRFSPRDRVVVAFDIVCGRCWFCRGGQTQLCEEFRNLGAGAFGGGLAGAQAERLRVPVADVNLLAIPDAVDDERALFVGDVLTTGYYAASIAEPGSGDSVAVVGCGPVGYACIVSLLAAGVEHVLALDRDPARLALAASAGADPVDVRTCDPQMAVADATQDRGADVVIEAVGRPEAFETAIGAVRRGGTVVVIGMYAGESTEIQLGVYWARALRIVFAGICPIHAWWERSMAEVASGRIDPTAMVSHRLPLERAPEGYALFGSREATKVVLRP
jgi:threonine dehydrogenase-like Zn-dependent dehydrogenase